MAAKSAKLINEAAEETAKNSSPAPDIEKKPTAGRKKTAGTSAAAKAAGEKTSKGTASKKAVSVDASAENGAAEGEVSKAAAPAKKLAAKKTTVKKTSAKKTAENETADDTESSTKKTSTRKAAVKKTSTEKASAKKTADKKTSAKKSDKSGSKLVIVESPAKAKTIAKYLGKGYKVEASNGHVRDLPKSQLGIDVTDGFKPKYITIRGRGEIIDRLKREAKNASTVYLATDPDREGEAISWHLAHLLGIDESSACRIEFNEITKDAIKKAIKSPRRIDIDLVDAQQARRLLDRLVGYEISPILWRKVHKGLSAGRVQSVATRIVCDREDEIRDFVPEEYWTLAAKVGDSASGADIEAQYMGRMGENNGVHLPNEDSVNAIIAELQNETFTVDKIETTVKHSRPAAPFTTSSLQQEASRKYGFSTKRTMVLAQQLYEGVDIKGMGPTGLISYIRTDSVRIADEARLAAEALIRERYGDEYYPEKPNVFKGRNNSQDAHEAIRPTSLAIDPKELKASLSRDQLRLYTLVYNRFVASQMTSAVYETRAAQMIAGAYRFRASGTRLVFAGFRKVYLEEGALAEETPVLDERLTEGMKLVPSEFLPAQHFTEPPARFNEATLVRALEEQGIGRPSTYAPIISTILDKGYVSRESKLLYPTELGEIVTNLMKEYFANIVDVAFTADMEKSLDHVESGETDWVKILGDFYGPFEKTLEYADSKIEKIVIEDEVTDIICEKCGANMVIKNGRMGRFYACPNFPACRNTKSINQTINVPCPKCGGQVIVRRSKRGRTFYGCENYPACDFISWDIPVNRKCPKCGAYMVGRRGKNGDMMNVCSNSECGETLPAEQNDKDE